MQVWELYLCGIEDLKRLVPKEETMSVKSSTSKKQQQACERALNDILGKVYDCIFQSKYQRNKFQLVV